MTCIVALSEYFWKSDNVLNLLILVTTEVM